MGHTWNGRTIDVNDRIDGWMRLVVVAGGIYLTHADTTNKIDAGKDEQRTHWITERRHSDSLTRVFEDSVLRLLTKHIKK